MTIYLVGVGIAMMFNLDNKDLSTSGVVIQSFMWPLVVIFKVLTGELT